MLAQLIPSKGGEPVTLTEDITVVGRSSRLSDLVIDHSSISKIHCILVKTDGLVYMRDLRSTNGTRVNGQRVIRGALLPGDQLAFAGFIYKLFLGPDPVPSKSAEVITGLNPEIPEDGASGAGHGEESQSDVRLLGDSDFLPAD